MNSTSANVLLKSPVPTSAVAAAKRDYSQDGSSVSSDFQQTMKDAQERTAMRDDKASKVAAQKKSEGAEHQDALNAAKKAKRNTAESKPVDAEPATNISTIQAVSAKETVQADHTIKQDGSPAMEKDKLDDGQLSPIDQSVSEALIGPIATATTSETINSLLVVNDSLAAVSSDVGASVNLPPLNAAGGGLNNGVTAESNTVILPFTAVSNAAELAGIPAQQPAVNTEAFTANSALPITALQSSSEVTELSEDVAAMLVSVATGKPPIMAAATEVASSSPSDDKTDGGVAQLHMQSAAAAFEKTLQAVVASEMSTADDSAAQKLANPSSSTANSAMDAMLRPADTTAPATRGFVVQTAVPVPVGQPQWSQAVGEKVLWLAAQNVSSAEINLHPKDLGPLQVKVSVNQEQTTVSFSSQHAVVRDVLDQNINRLRDMFSEQGLNLVNVDVSDQSFSRQQGDAKDQKTQGGVQDATLDDETPIAMSSIIQQRLVDHYA